jgi:hypothetical protein
VIRFNEVYGWIKEPKAIDAIVQVINLEAR